MIKDIGKYELAQIKSWISKYITTGNTTIVVQEISKNSTYQIKIFNWQNMTSRMSINIWERSKHVISSLECVICTNILVSEIYVLEYKQITTILILSEYPTAINNDKYINKEW